ncbi:MAG: DUF2339 domain-containing protein [Candidatus Omnitrophica bacterium]|nr:DUF2339 domain-containing protein [Candidatus Omnitrophota bacterium]
MRQCPQCRKKYDQTWTICFHCNQPLYDENIALLPPDIRDEFNALKVLSASVSGRIARLEEKLQAFGANREDRPDASSGFEHTPPEPAVSFSSEDPVISAAAAEKKGEADAQSLENKIGGIWFNRIGVLAIILGMGFFLKYVFDNNWIGPLGRVVLGLIAGVAMILTGEYSYRKQYKIFAEGLIAGGAAILYLSVYSAVNFYHLIPAVIGFGFMAVVTLFAATFAVRFDSPRVLNLSVIGGFLTPFLIFVHGIDPRLFLAYIAVLDIGILGVGYFKKWAQCNLFALVLTYFTYFSWFVSGYRDDNFRIAEIFLTVYFGLFSVIAILHNFIRKQQATSGDMAVVIFNGIFYFLANYALLSRQSLRWQHLGFLPITLGVLYCLFSYSAFARTRGKDQKLILSYLSLTILFATITIPIELKAHWVTLGFMIEATVLVWLGCLLRSAGLRKTGLVLAAAALLKLLTVDTAAFDYSATAAAYQVVLNKRFFTYLSASVAGLICAGLYQKHKPEIGAGERNTATALVLTSAFILLVNLSLEVHGFFATRDLLAAGPYTTGHRHAPVRYYVEQFSLSALWVVYSFVLLVIGIFRKFRAMRIMALILFMLTIAKVFLFDVSSIGRGWRILSFVGLGGVLVITSFMYQKYKNKIFGFIAKD